MLTLLSLPFFAQGQVVRGTEASTLLTEHIQRPELLQLRETPSGRFRRCQFEIKWYLPQSDTGSRPIMRTICETKGNEAALLVMSPGGIPYAYFGTRHAYFCDADKANRVAYIRGIKFRLDSPTANMSPSLKISSALENSSCVLDLASFCGEILAEPDSECIYWHANRLFRVANSYGAFSEIRFNREWGKWSFPISHLSSRGVHGEGYEITNLQLGPRIVRSILDMERVLEMEVGAELYEAAAKNEVMFRFLPINDLHKMEHLFANQNVRITGAAWLESIKAAEDGHILAMDKLLETLKTEMQSPQPERDKMQKGFEDLYEALIVLVDQQLTAGNDGTDLYVVAGRDTTGSDARMEALFGRPTQLAIYDVVVAGVTCEHLSETDRIRIADTLGIVGLNDPRHQLDNLQEAVGSSDSMTLQYMLPTVAVRNAVASEKDIAKLRTGVNDETLPIDLRLYCLESIFLADAADGLAKQCAEVFNRGKSHRFLCGRCLLAAACSKEGRSLLIQGLKNNDMLFGPELPLAVLVGRVKRNDPESSVLMAAGKRYALDSTQGIGTQRLGAAIAAVDRDDEEFRDRFIRSALMSQHPVLIRCAVFDYLLGAKEIHKYCDDLSAALDHVSPQMRAQILIILAISVKDTMKDEHKDSLRRLAEKVKNDKDQAVRIIADQLYQKLREPDPLRL